MITCSLNVEKQGLDCCSHYNCPDAKTDNKPDILVHCRHLHPDSFPSVYVLEQTKLKKSAVYIPRLSTGELQYEESFSFHVIDRKYDLSELKQAVLATDIWFNSVLPWFDRFEKKFKRYVFLYITES
jgi:hypothetical protein